MQKRKYDRRSLTAAAVCSLLEAALVIWCVAGMLFYRGDGNMSVTGLYAFIYFTVDSNLLSAVCGIVTAVCAFRAMGMVRRRQKEGDSLPDVFPRWAVLLQYSGTAAVSVTLLTVLLFLGPNLGYASMFAGKNLYLHLICPILSIITLCFLIRAYKISMAETSISVLPTFFYAIVYVRQTVFLGYENGGWHDFYGFNHWNTWPLAALIMLLGTWIIGLVLRAVHNRFAL